MTDISPEPIKFSAPLPWHLKLWGKLAEQYHSKELAHAYLIQGESGLGKSLFVNAFAHFMLCEDKKEYSACGRCTNCLKGGIDNHPDIFQLAAEEGSKDIKIDQIRSLSEFAIRTSHTGAAKIVVIHNAHQLNSSAANALLKTLEEPGQQTYLFLISDFPGKLVATIRSRCQKINFPRPTHDQANEWLHSVLGGTAGVEDLLNATDNNPMQALSLAGGDELELKQQFLNSLAELALGRTSIHSALGLIAKIGEKEGLRYMAANTSILIKCLLSSHDTKGMQSSAQELVSSAMQLPRTTLARQLLIFHSEVELARKQLAASTNPNPQLIMESLLWHWSKVFHIRAAANIT